MVLLGRGHAQPEHRGLREMILERIRAYTALNAVGSFGIAGETAVDFRNFFRPTRVDGIRIVICGAGVDRHTMYAVALAAAKWANRAIDGNFVKVGAAQPCQLRIEI